MVSKFVFPDGVEDGAAAGGRAHSAEGKKREGGRREEGGEGASEIASQVGSNIR